MKEVVRNFIVRFVDGSQMEFANVRLVDHDEGGLRFVYADEKLGKATKAYLSGSTITVILEYETEV